MAPRGPVVQTGLAFALGGRPHSHNQEVVMSADKDRGIRRQKQKRAKALKKAEQQPKKPADTAPAKRSAS